MATKKRTNDSGELDPLFMSLRNAQNYTASTAEVPDASKWTSETIQQIIPLYEVATDFEIQKNIILQRWALEILKKERTMVNVSDVADRLGDIKRDLKKNNETELNKRTSEAITDNIHWLKKKAAQKTLPAFNQMSGGMSLIAGASAKNEEVKELSIYSPEIQELLSWSNVVWRNPYVIGSPGTGKTNMVVLLTAWNIFLNQGSIFDTEMAMDMAKSGQLPSNQDWYRKQGIMRGTLRVYFPNIQFPIEEPAPNKRLSDLKVYPYSYAYKHAWEIFLDDPPGSSVLWVKHDQTMNKRLNLGIRPESIYAMVYMGEMGKGRKMESGTSLPVQSMMVNFQLSRQVGVRFFQSGATASAAQIMDVVDPMIEMVATPTGKRDMYLRPKMRHSAIARYLIPGAKAERRVDLGVVPLHPLTESLNDAISADMSGEFGILPLKEIFDSSGITNPIIYEKDTRTAILNVDQAIRELFKINSRNEYPDGEKVKDVQKIVSKRNNHDDETDHITL